MPENQPSIETLAVQMKYVAETLTDIKALLNSHAQTMSRIPVIEAKLETHSDQIGRAFSSIKGTSDRVDKASTEISHAKGMFKVVSAILTFVSGAAISIAAWSYNQLDTLKSTDRDLLLRISSLEIRSNEAEKRYANEAERFSKQGWIRQ